MGQMMNCRALVEIRLNTPQAETEGHLLRPGETFLYDGYKAVIKNTAGLEVSTPQPRLGSTLNEWYEELGPVSEASQASDVAPVVPDSSPKTSAVMEEFEKTRQAESQGGSSVKRNESTEESLPGGDGPPQNLNEMVSDYEKQTSKGTVIVDDDASIVGKTTDVEGAEKGNVPGVQTKTAAEEKRVVVSQEERAVKETNYEKKVEGSEPKPVRKKPEIISDGEGEVVAKTSVPAINKNQVKQRETATKAKTGTFRENEAVSETDYSEEGKSTDVGSTTQTKATSTKAARTGKTSAQKKVAESAAARRKAAGIETIDVDNQDAQVVGKTRKTNEVKDTADGIHVQSSVGAVDEMKEPVATTSSSNEGIIIGDEATVGSGTQDVDISDILGDA